MGCRAHPHVCGEHMTETVIDTAPEGSSPRMRGTLYAPGSTVYYLGLIPTYAGNTLSGCMRCCPAGAHPHVCGEHLRLSLVALPALGSSPRMRGTPSCRLLKDGTHGLIPTYAGNTLLSLRVFSRTRAHPHVCGEHEPAEGTGESGVGSSPRMRGTPINKDN